MRECRARILTFLYVYVLVCQAKTKGADPSLSQLLAALACDKAVGDKLCRLGELQAEADKAGASPAGTCCTCMLYLHALLALLGELEAEADQAGASPAGTCFTCMLYLRFTDLLYVRCLARSGVGGVAAGREAAGRGGREAAGAGPARLGQRRKAKGGQERARHILVDYVC